MPLRSRGPAGMLETIRASGRLHLRPRRRGFLGTATAGLVIFLGTAASALAQTARGGPLSWIEPYLSALASLDRHELAALALTPAVLCFAVVTAIALVRTRARAAQDEITSRDRLIQV